MSDGGWSAPTPVRRPTVVLFDVNETLSNLAPLADRFAEVGITKELAPSLAKLWFASVLRDGISLAAAGGCASFKAVATQALRTVLHGESVDRGLEDAVQHVLAGFTQLPVHADVPEGLAALKRAGLRLATLSNGASSVAEALLAGTDVRRHFDDGALLSVDGAGTWKPARRSYEYAARALGVDPADVMLVAVHPWDVDGASRAGMSTAWIDRARASQLQALGDSAYPEYFCKPSRTVHALTELAAAIADM